jgi:hypothetical protein
METIKPNLEYFAPQKIQTYITRSFMREYSPISALQHLVPIRFTVPGSDSLYLDLSKSYIYVRAKITLNNGNNLAAGEEVGPINLSLHSMFSSIEVQLGGKVITDTNGLYPFRAYLETLLNSNRDLQETQLETALWYKDVANHFQAFDCGNNGVNTGLVARARYFRQSAEVEMMGRPHCDIFHQDRPILPNVSLDLRLFPSADNFLLVSPAPGNAANQENYRFQILDIRFCIYSMELSNSMILVHRQILTKANARYPIRRVAMKHISIPRGYQTAQYDNIFLGILPNRIAIVLVNDAMMAGGYQQNPFDFQHYNLNHLCLYVNGEQFPSKPFNPNFANNLYIKEYHSLFEAFGIQFSDHTVAISRSDYPHGFTIFVFNLNPDPQLHESVTPFRNGSIRVEIKFAQPAAQTLNLLIYSEFDSIIEIDKYHNVIGPT